MFAKKTEYLSGRTAALALAAVFPALFAVALAVAAPAAADTAPTTCGGRTATIVGTPGPDTLRGTPGVDVIAALGGNDTVFGLGGDDLICGGSGSDELRGGKGADRLFGFDGSDELHGGQGPDELFGGHGQDAIFGKRGRDYLSGGPDEDDLRGGPNRDLLDGGAQVDVLNGGAQLDECRSSNDVSSNCETGDGSSPTVTPAERAEQLETEMFRLINLERSREPGLAPLTRHRDLDAYASAWARAMSEQPLPLERSRHHSPAFSGSDISFQGIPRTEAWTHAFENVGYTAVLANESVESVMERLFYTPNGSGFTTSSAHRCVILETGADDVGVGAFVDSNGAVWVAQLFWGNNSPAPEPIESCTSVIDR